MNDAKLQKSLQKICSFWQKLLRLGDWEIDLQVVRCFDISEERAADLGVFAEKKHATIRLLHPNDCDPDWKPSSTPEHKIVHELLHLHLNPFSQYEDDDKRIAEEQVVHILSILLVDLARRVKV